MASCSGMENLMIAVPSDVQYRWQEAERSMFIHFGPATWQGREYDDGSVPVEQINPKALDTGQWCRAALAFGARRIVFVAKHTGGFCWWQTDTTQYSIKNSPWKDGKGDVLQELSDSCKKYGLTLGIYIYPGDRTWGAYIGGGGRTKDPSKQEAYSQIFRTQLTEVLSKYGAIEEVWFDGSCVIEVGDILERYAREAVIFQGRYATIRWCGTERGTLPDPAWSSTSKEALATGMATVVQSDPEGDAWAPLEVDTTLYDHFWFWSPDNAKKQKSLADLMQIYYHSAGRGSVLLLNASPNTDGLIPDEDMRLLETFGKEIDRRFQKPLAEVSGEDTCLILQLDKPQKVNHVVLMEDYRKGERVRRYRLEADVQGQWMSVASGYQIGRKRILVFGTVETEALRLVVEDAADMPFLRSMAAFYVEVEDLENLIASCRAVSLVYNPETDSWQTSGEGTKVFEWSADEIEGTGLSFEVDISGVVTEPGQYELLFAVEGTKGLRIDDLQAILEGEATQGVLTAIEPGCRYNLTRTSAVEDAEGGTTGLRGHISCPKVGQRGKLTVRKVV